MTWSLDLKGRGGVVTGASSGIGAAIVRALAACGARVVGWDVADAPDALFAAAGTLLDATVLGAPCPAAYGQVMRVLARLNDMNIAEAVRNAALR